MALKINMIVLIVIFFSVIGSSISIAKTTEDFETLYRLTNRYLQQKKYDNAIEASARARDQALKEFGEGHENYYKTIRKTAEIFYKAKKLDSAISYIDLELNVLRNQKRDSTLEFADAYYLKGIINSENGNSKDSEYALVQSLNLYRNLLDPYNPRLTSILFSVAGLYKNLGNLKFAYFLYKNSLDIDLQKIRKDFPLMNKYEKLNYYYRVNERLNIFYNFAIENKEIDKNLPSDILRYHINTKNFFFFPEQKLLKNLINPEKNSQFKEFELWSQLKDSLSGIIKIDRNKQRILGQNVEKLKDTLQNLCNELSKKSLDFKQWFNTEVIDWRQTASKLDNDEAIIDFIRVPDNRTDKISYIVLIVKKSNLNNPELVVLSYGSELEGKYLEQYKNSLAMQYTDTDSFNFFWYLIHQKIESQNRIYISTDGVYSLLNPETLYLNSEKKYLGEKADFYWINKFNDVALVKNASRLSIGFNSNLKIIADPDYLLTSLDDQRYLDYEFSSIKHELQNATCNLEVLSGKEIKELSVSRSLVAEIIHIAGYFYYFNDYYIKYAPDMLIYGNSAIDEPGLKGGLLTSELKEMVESEFENSEQNDKESDGLVSNYEIQNLNLDHTKLVFLSNSVPGIKKWINWDDIQGLINSILTSGSKSIILPLWENNRYSNRMFVEEFYKQIIKGEYLSKAIRNAKNMVREHYLHPYYWGNYILVN